MSTLWQYVPFVGDFSADGIQMVTQDGDVVPQNPSPGSFGPAGAGRPRPGVLKWGFQLDCGDPSVNPGDSEILISVPAPFRFTQQDVDTRINGLVPLVYSSLGRDVSVQEISLEPLYQVNVATQRVIVRMRMITVNPTPVTYNITVDFSHSIAN